MKTTLCFAALATGLLSSTTFAAAAVCGPVTIANMNWQSGELLANVDKVILSEGYGWED